MTYHQSSIEIETSLVMVQSASRDLQVVQDSFCYSILGLLTYSTEHGKYRYRIS